jgi:hypothetical protein
VARDIAVDGGDLGTGRSDSGSGKYDGVFAVTDRAINSLTGKLCVRL